LADRRVAAHRLKRHVVVRGVGGEPGEDRLDVAPVPGGAELADNGLGIAHGGSLARGEQTDHFEYPLCHVWHISTPIENVSPEEMQRRDDDYPKQPRQS